MINSIAQATQAVAVNGDVVFTSSPVRTKSSNQPCGWLQHADGTGIFTLTKPGIYEVMYNANITSADTGQASLVLENNGVAIPGTQSIYTVATASALGNLSASTFVQVSCGEQETITLVNNSTLALNVQDANITIKKLC